MATLMLFLTLLACGLIVFNGACWVCFWLAVNQCPQLARHARMNWLDGAAAISVLFLLARFFA
jgi:hypothetical protein